MRIGLIPDGLYDRALFASRRFPRPVFDVMGMMLFSRAVMAGVHFRVFDRLASGARTADELAKEAGCDPHGMKLLLEALAACGYLEVEEERYRNTRLATDWLLSESPQTLANFVRFNYDQWDWVSHLEEFIGKGESRDIHEKLDEAGWRNYMLGLRDLSLLSADEVVAKIRLNRPRSLLDVAGGHCQYSIAMCRRYPGLKATVVDLEPAVRIGRELVARAGLADRIAFRIGSLTETPFGENHDTAFLFNIVHHLDEAANRATLERLQAALAPGGTLVVYEPFREDRERQKRDQLGSLMALFFGVTSRRQTYGFAEVADWAAAAGFRRIRKERLRTAPFASLLVATK